MRESRPLGTNTRESRLRPKLGKLPFSKARTLTILTRETPDSDRSLGNKGTISVQRTDRFYGEIKRLAKEIEKGALGGLRTEKGVAFLF